MISKKPLVTLDVETYRNYFLVMFRRVADGKIKYFELFTDFTTGEVGTLDIDAIQRILRASTIVTFNGRTYDIPILTLALNGATNLQLKGASDRIIQTNMKPWEFEDDYGVRPPRYLDHIDLIEVAPGQASLKLYGGRLHSQKLQDLPIDPDALIEENQRVVLRLYCGNDHITTADMLTKLTPQLELRVQMSAEYGIDLRSKSDAQIAEAVIRSKLQEITGVKPQKPKLTSGTLFHYVAPDFISYQTEELRDTLAMVEREQFLVRNGKVYMPKMLEDAKITIGSSVYRMGIGGLHSSESEATHYSDDEYVLIDRDVASYYPAIILQCGLYPKHLGKEFLTVYRSIVNRRLAAKKAGDKVTAESLKITINGSFGKFGNAYSLLFSPNLLIQTTVTGQLALLMLIEALELEGIPVVSANTDGVVIRCPRAKLDRLNAHIRSWEFETGFTTEDTEYRALHSRDVNNYIAIKPDGSVKLKGAYAPPGLQKNPSNEICIEAVVAYLKEGTPLRQTIESCTDPRKFITVRRVAGGGLKGDQYLGKTVRWYYAVGEEGYLEYKTNGNKVAASDGAMPLMQLTETLPDDIDYDRYEHIAYEILMDIGVVKRPPPPPKKKTKKQLKEEAKLFDAELEACEL